MKSSEKGLQGSVNRDVYLQPNFVNIFNYNKIK
jgi:hypothetical protein